MSTLAACRADNFYQPPDYDPKNRKKEIEKKRKEGRLKVRKQGSRKIRFEMPFHIRCTDCHKMTAKGVRFNAVKKKAGRYLGTIIFQFVMPCPGCKSTMIIKTDPKNCEYLLVSGCVRYNDDYDQTQTETIKIQTPEEGEQLNRNPFLKLENTKIDIIKGEAEKPILFQLVNEKKIYKNDFYINQTLRRKLKMEKNQIQREENESKSLGLDIKLLPTSQADKINAQKADFKSTDNSIKFNARDTLRLEPIFKNNLFLNPNQNVKNTQLMTLLKKKQKLDRNLQIALETHRPSHEDTKSFADNFKLNTHVIFKKK